MRVLWSSADFESLSDAVCLLPYNGHGLDYRLSVRKKAIYMGDHEGQDHPYHYSTYLKGKSSKNYLSYLATLKCRPPNISYQVERDSRSTMLVSPSLERTYLRKPKCQYHSMETLNRCGNGNRAKE